MSQPDPRRLVDRRDTPRALADAIREARGALASAREVEHLADAMRRRAGQGRLRVRHPLRLIGAVAITLAGAGWTSLQLTTMRAHTPHVASSPPPMAAPAIPDPQLATAPAPSTDTAPAPVRLTAAPPLQPKAARSQRRRAASEPEIALLDHSQAALQTDPARALAWTQEHLRAYPSGVFVQEREILAIEALHKLRRHAEAAARARKFLVAYPQSPHARRLSALVATAVIPGE